MLTYRCPEREDVAINEYDQLAGTQVWSSDEDFLSNLTLLGKLQLLDRLLPEDMSGCEIIEEDGKITVREKNHTLTCDYSWITRAINT